MGCTMSETQVNLEGKPASKDTEEEEETRTYITIRTSRLQIRLSESGLETLLAKRTKEKDLMLAINSKVRIRPDLNKPLSEGEWDKHIDILARKIRSM